MQKPAVVAVRASMSDIYKNTYEVLQHVATYFSGRLCALENAIGNAEVMAAILKEMK